MGCCVALCQGRREPRRPGRWALSLGLATYRAHILLLSGGRRWERPMPLDEFKSQKETQTTKKTHIVHVCHDLSSFASCNIMQNREALRALSIRNGQAVFQNLPSPGGLLHAEGDRMFAARETGKNESEIERATCNRQTDLQRQVACRGGTICRIPLDRTPPRQVRAFCRRNLGVASSSWCSPGSWIPTRFCQ